MSRTPPSSIRLPSILHYPQVAASLYYYKAHLKDGITVEKAVDQLGTNLGFFTGVVKRKKRLPLLTLGVLPIYTQLRAKKYYHRLITKSKHWFVAKLFRGAQSNALSYHNAAVYNTLQTRSKFERGFAAQNNVCSHEQIYTSTANVIQSLATLEPVSWSGLRTLQTPQCDQHGLKPASHRPHQRQTWHTHKHSIIEFAGRFSLIAVTNTSSGGKTLPARSSKDKPLASFVSNHTGFFTFARGPKARGLLTHRHTGTYPQLRSELRGQSCWSQNGMFVLFCIEQIIGKRNRNQSNLLTALACAQVTTENNKKQFKKGFKKPYHISLIKQLEQDQYLVAQKGSHYPQSSMDGLRRNRSYGAQKNSIYNTKGGQRGTHLQSANRQSTPGSHPPVRNLEYEIDKLQNYAKSTPKLKFWVSRAFNKPMAVNLFHYIEGRVGRGHMRETVFQKASLSNPHSVVSARLKSGFVFEFDVHSKTSEVVNSLRPTVSLRF